MTAEEWIESWQLSTLTSVLCASRFHLFVELDVRIVEQLGYSVHTLANWMADLAPSARELLMERTWVMDRDSTQQRAKSQKQ